MLKPKLCSTVTTTFLCPGPSLVYPVLLKLHRALISIFITLTFSYTLL